MSFIIRCTPLWFICVCFESFQFVFFSFCIFHNYYEVYYHSEIIFVLLSLTVRVFSISDDNHDYFCCLPPSQIFQFFVLTLRYDVQKFKTFPFSLYIRIDELFHIN